MSGAFGRTRPIVARPRREGEVVILMGIPGAGKSIAASSWVDRGHVRLNRDERGGTLRGIAESLDELLAGGAERVVLDNTYLTRSARGRVTEVASRHGLPVRCVWLDTPLAEAQVNLVERFLERLGRLPEPDELRTLSRREPGLLAPTSQMRALRELEPPSVDEGFASVERVTFVRRERRGRAGVFVAAAAAGASIVDPEAPHLVFDWRPEGDGASLAQLAEGIARLVTGPVETAFCPHAAGPPVCWCRPPLPGLPLAFARAHGIDPARSILVGTSAAHRSLAAALGARFLDVDPAS